MAQREFELDCLVPVAPDVVIDFLADLANHHGLHPYLVEAVVLAEGASTAGPYRQWQVLERPRLGPVRYPIRFEARLTRTSATSFTSHVRAAPGCTIDALTTASPGSEPGTAHVHERSVVRAPVGLIGYMARQAEVAHRRTMRLLPDVLAESGR
jgi:hypothetical protein